MKKTFLAVFVLLLLSQTIAVTPPLPMAIAGGPTPPQTGECVDTFSISNVRCSGDIRLYDQCIPFVTGNEWQSRTENCKAYGAGWVCTEGDCLEFSNDPIFDNPQTFTIIFLTAIVGIIIGIGAFALKRRLKL